MNKAYLVSEKYENPSFDGKCFADRFLPHLQRLQRLARPIPKIAYQVFQKWEIITALERSSSKIGMGQRMQLVDWP